MKALTRMRLPLGILALALIATIAITFVLSTHAISHAASSPNKGSRTYTYKTHVTGDADSGTCGINWATDSFDRNFSINTSNTSIFQVVFKNGKFVTTAGPSPNACANNGTSNGNTVGSGITGTLTGSYTNVAVSGGTFNPQATCTNGACDTTAGFVATVYGPSATYSVGTYDFNYVTDENGGATQDSNDVGGYNGDITGTLVANPNVKSHITVKHSLR